MLDWVKMEDLRQVRQERQVISTRCYTRKLNEIAWISCLTCLIQREFKIKW